MGIEVTGDIQKICWALWICSSSGETVGIEKIDQALERLFAMDPRNYEDTVAMLVPSQLKVPKTLANPESNSDRLKFRSAKNAKRYLA